MPGFFISSTGRVRDDRRRRGSVGLLRENAGVDEAFIGSEALRDGVVANKPNCANGSALYPDVYLPMGATPTPAQRTAAAWLWTRRQGVIAGSAASAMH